MHALRLSVISVVLRSVIFALVSFCTALAARADVLDQIRERGELVWGADQEGGAPFVFADTKDPGKFRGFEVELAEMLAGELGVKARFQQGDWTGLPLLLNRGTIDVVLNGYELTPQRKQDFLCTRPYYIYGLQLLARRDSLLKTWADVRSKVLGRPARIGVLDDSGAEKHLVDDYPGLVDIVAYEGNTEAMQQVATGAIDATLQDDCIALFYADQFPELKFVDRPVGSGYYVALVARGESRLLAALDEALGRMIVDGRLQQLYDRWNMSGQFQTLALRDSDEIRTPPDRTLGEVLHDSLGVLLKGAGMTVFLSFASMPLAILAGILVAVGRMYGPLFISKLLGLYVEVIRGTPLMLQLYVIFFLLPELGLFVPALAAAIAGLAINYSAYEAEIYRAGLQAIPTGQMEAALALGMTRGQAVRRIVLPQAFRIVIPPVTNDFIALFKDTSVCSVITVVELTKQYNILARNNTETIVQLAAITAALYLLMSYPLSLFARWSEKCLAQGKKL